MKNLPHTTLFQGTFKEGFDHRKTADFIAERFTELFPDRTVSFSGAEYRPEGWYFYVMQKTSELQQLHETVLELAVPHLDPDPERMILCLTI